MEYIKYIVIGLLILFVVSRMLPVKGVNNLVPSEVKSKMKNKNAQFIDVRSPGEYNVGHVKEFKNIPLHALKNELNQLDKNKEIVLICQSGNRSMQACRVLKKHGFNNLTNVRGGMNMWRN